MIREYAINPDLFCDSEVIWHRLGEFGSEKGRMISSLPPNWIEKVSRCAVQGPQIGWTARQKRIELLNNRKASVLRAREERCAPRKSDDWLELAAISHQQEEFAAIIHHQRVEGREEVLVVDDLHDDQERWKVSSSRHIRRTVGEIADCAGPLGRFSRIIRFVDPHFSGERGHCDVLEEVLRRSELGKQKHFQSIEYHTLTNATAEHIRQKCSRSKSLMKRNGTHIEVFLWKDLGEIRHGHDRYILTDIGGISIGWGLDAGEESQETVVTLLSLDDSKRKQDEFVLDSMGKRSKKYELRERFRIG